MNAEQLRAAQGPLKQRYRDDPSAALVTLHARGQLVPEELACKIARAHPSAAAGLHPAAGGDGSYACSGDMLLEALVACAGTTLCAVAHATKLPLRGGTARAEGDLDFRGTLGVAKDAPVGFSAIRLAFELDSDATDAQLAKLRELTDRYCVVFHSLRVTPTTSIMTAPRGV